MKKRSTSTQQLMDELCELQKELRISGAQLVDKIGISWLTFHFLKTGKTTNPNSITLKKIRTFLRMHNRTDDFELVPGPGIIRQARKICFFCSKYPQVKEELLEEMNCIIRETLQEYGAHAPKRGDFFNAETHKRINAEALRR